MPTIVKRPLARSDLAEIWDYIADANESRADTFVELIDRKFHELASHPNMGRSRVTNWGKACAAFRLVDMLSFTDPYLRGIEIIRVLHGSRDLDAIFNPDD